MIWESFLNLSSMSILVVRSFLLATLYKHGSVLSEKKNFKSIRESRFFLIVPISQTVPLNIKKRNTNANA